MSEKIVLNEYRKLVDGSYVGFSPNGSSIKPVHIAGGALRCIYGKFAKQKNIKLISYPSKPDGTVPDGQDEETVKRFLIDNEKMDEEVEINDLKAMRSIMQKLLNVDKGVFFTNNDNMISYSAASKYFITKKSMYEDAGEFIGGIIKDYCPDLAKYIKSKLDEANDPISILFKPVANIELEIYEKSLHDEICAFNNKNEAMEFYIRGINQAGICLLHNLENHPNPLTQFRLFNLFCIFNLIRYLSMLEAFYCKENIRPILIDFTGNSQSSIARASQMSYTQIHRAISRFYAWAYAQKLESETIDDLLKSETPVYEKNKKISSEQKELERMWDIAKEEAKNCKTDEEVRILFGTEMYDMLALAAESHPVNYIRILGTQSGILYPPDRMHPNKRFVISQDILEMILRCCVCPNEVLDGMELRQRLWERFGIIIGGTSFELEKLQTHGMILQVDEDSLENNFMLFSKMLESMDFAEVMADGILQIRLGGVNK